MLLHEVLRRGRGLVDGKVIVVARWRFVGGASTETDVEFAAVPGSFIEPRRDKRVWGPFRRETTPQDDYGIEESPICGFCSRVCTHPRRIL